MHRPLQRRVCEIFAVALLCGTLLAHSSDPALAPYFQGNALYNKRLYPLAADEFRAFLAKHPTHAKADAARFGLALCLFAQNDYAGTEPLLKALEGKLEPTQADQVILMHGQTLLELNRPADAESKFAAGLARSANAEVKSRCLAGLVEALYRQRKWDDVAKRAEEFLKDHREGDLATRVRTQAALGAFEREDYKTAAAMLEALGVREHKLGQQGWFLWAESKRQLGDRGAARQGFEEARKLEGAHRAEALLRLGYMSFEDRGFDQTISLLEELKVKEPKSPIFPSAVILLGRAYLEKNDIGRAKATLAAVNSASALYWRARCALKEQKPDEAIQFLRDAASRFPADPISPDVNLELGNALLLRETYAEAASAFAKVPDRPAALYLRGYALHQDGKYAESLAVCDQFIAQVKEPDTQSAEEVAFIRAENLFLLNRPDEAVTAFQGFLNRYPRSANAAVSFLRIGQSCYRQERWKEAGDAFKSVIDRNPKREGLFQPLDFYAAECFAATNQPDQAISLYERFLAGTPPEAEKRDTALFKMGTIQGSRNQAADAVRRYEELAERYPKSTHRPEALVEIGRLSLGLKDLERGKRALVQFSQQYGRHELISQAQYYQGWIALEEKREVDARKHFRAVVKAPDALLYDARFQAALLALSAGDFKAAAQALNELPADKVEKARLNDLRFRLGLAQAKASRWADARKTLTSLLENGPEPSQRARARYELAWCCKGLKDAKGAIAEYTELLKQDANSEFAPRAALELAELEYETGHGAAAAARLKPLLQSPDESLAMRAAFRLGWCQFEARDFSEAAASFERALAKAGAAPEIAGAAAYQAGEARRELREYPAAIAHYARAAEIRSLPGDALRQEQALLRLAETQGLNGQYSESLSSCDRFLATFPASEVSRRVRFSRGWALENLARHPEAIAAYQAITAEPKPDETSARAQFQIGECYLARNELDQAIKELVKVEVNFAKNEWTPKALLQIGAALERKNDPVNARAHYEEVIRDYANSPSAKVAQARLTSLPAPKP